MAERRREVAELMAEILERHGSMGVPMNSRGAKRKTRIEDPSGRIREISHQTIENWMDGHIPTRAYARWFMDAFN